ncbi:type IV pilus biogenesis/stability protein PilW [Chromatiales bacterium (ex Bugula neritina AB1)]|nr:type IV pilus biogenesis/stability protein PilW [Chromatiales bacterium (ex Bugula neritina AB1)]
MKKTVLLALTALCTVASGCAMNPIYGRLTDDQKAASYNAELGTNYLATGDLEHAQLKLHRALSQDPDNALANNTFGKLLAELDKPAAAERSFLKSIKLDVNRAEYRNNYGIFLCDHERSDEAIEQFLKASENKFYKTPEFALDNAGVCAMDSNKLEEANLHLRAAIRQNPVFAPALLHMAELKLKTGDALLADAYYSRFLTLARQTPQSLYVGINIRRKLGDHSAVDQFAEQLVSAYPRSSQARTYLASQ